MIARIPVVVPLALLLSCSGAAVRPAKESPPTQYCALIETDDDIPSGSATAGALFIGEDELGQRLLTSDVLSVAQGFRDAGYECIVVADSHERALDHKRLTEAGLRVITPSKDKDWRWPFFGVAGPQFKIAALVGFHARAGAPGFRQHTVNDYIKRITIDGVEAGEIGMATLGLQAVGMLPVLVVGDEGAAAEARVFAPDARGVAVRWHDETGAVRFLSEAEAPAVLRSAAKEAATKPAPARAWRYPLPLVVEAKRAGMADGAAAAAVARMKEARAELGSDAGDTSIAPVAQGKSVTWTAADGRAAYLSLVAVASSIRPPNRDEAWEWIGRGFDACRAGRHEEAVTAYRKALALDPADSETRCRIGNVYLATGSMADAVSEFSDGVQHIDEIDGPMRVVCLLGFAQSLERAGRGSEAVAAYKRVLEVPEHNGSHAKAREALDRIAHAGPHR